MKDTSAINEEDWLEDSQISFKIIWLKDDGEPFPEDQWTWEVKEELNVNEDILLQCMSLLLQGVSDLQMIAIFSNKLVLGPSELPVVAANNVNKGKIAAVVSTGNQRVDQYVTSYFNLERKQFELNQGVPQSKVKFLKLSQMEEKDSVSTKLLIVCHSTDDGMLMIGEAKYSLLQLLSLVARVCPSCRFLALVACFNFSRKQLMLAKNLGCKLYNIHVFLYTCKELHIAESGVLIAVSNMLFSLPDNFILANLYECINKHTATANSAVYY